ncbi:schwannomin-interacting protein 1 isoform X1 [Astyanax mexicanus]|uniref:schwannomin-interacting protein 1 isoform X1 n=1 Tax=Astyanax mexicanus TaxID=7994 RepID=UPI0020CB26AA|nr:schwannomin-interacting protein 1 isoform X1 [Astyanax mexicanus]XP_007236267.3 schwannomin-interacting protein 1 isoform X1 [Astyanax mexicanus]
MEEEADSNGQEEHRTDDPALSGPKEKTETQLQHGQEPSTPDQDLPIMHWEDLSLRIAELEKQEEERRKRAESKSSAEQESELGQWSHVKQQSPLRKQWEDDDGFGGCRFPFITSRFTSPKNLQLCFVNNSDSEEEDDEGTSSKKGSRDTAGRGRCCAGLKQEVRAALSELRDKLWAELKQQQQQPSRSDLNIRRKMLSRSDLQTCSVLQLNALSASLSEDIQDLSSELVKHLVVRDNLRIKQDAMLLDVQDMTSS